jgi:hypothetical protein
VERNTVFVWVERTPHSTPSRRVRARVTVAMPPKKTKSGKSAAKAEGGNIMKLARQVAPHSAALLAEAFEEDDDDDTYDYDFDDEGNLSGNASPLSLPSSMMSDEQGDSFHATLPQAAYAVPSSRGEAGAAAGAEETIGRLKHEKELLALDLQRERQRYQTDMRALRTQTRGQMEAVRKKQTALEAELPVLRQRVEGEKDRFRDLVMSDSLYQEMCAIPEDKRSVREFVLCKVHALLGEERSAKEQAQREVESLRTAVQRGQEDSDRRNRDAEHRAKIAEEHSAQLESMLQQAEQRAQALADKVQECVKEVEVNRGKALAYDDVERKGKDAMNERDALTERNDRLEKRVNYLEQQAATRENESVELRSQVSILTVDKSYLQRENASQASRVEVLNKDVENLRMKNRALSRAKDEFYEQLLEAKDAARTGYEQRLAGDVEKLHLANERELSQVRDATQRVYERENATLRDAKHDAEERLKQCSLKLSAVERAHDESRLALARAHGDREAETGELRARVKVKEYELERAMISIEEKSQEIKSLTAALEQTQARFNVLREEFARLDALSSASITGAHGSGQPRLLDGGPHTEQQNATLRHRVEALERQKKALESKLERVEQDYQDLRQSTSQPQEYFVDLVEKAKLESDKLRAEIDTLQGEVEALTRGKENAEAQLKSLLENREQLAALRQQLQRAGIVNRQARHGGGAMSPRTQQSIVNEVQGQPKWYKRLNQQP